MDACNPTRDAISFFLVNYPIFKDVKILRVYYQSQKTIIRNGSPQLNRLMNAISNRKKK